MYSSDHVGLPCNRHLHVLRVVASVHVRLVQLAPALLKRLAGLGSIVEAPLLACMLTELLQAVLEWDQLKVSCVAVAVARSLPRAFSRSCNNSSRQLVAFALT